MEPWGRGKEDVGIKGWSLRDGILEGEGWSREMLGGLVGSPHGGCRVRGTRGLEDARRWGLAS